jgi:carbonic anhydrase
MKYKTVFPLITLFIVFMIKTSGQGVSGHTNGSKETPDPDTIINWLKAGNNEFVHGQFNVHAIDSSLRIALSTGQHPKAVILTCSDSRVPPELIFNKSLGDLFVIRVAGNISDDAVVASIEYAVEHLHTSLVVVMGHQNCGAIGAAVADMQNPGNKIDNHVRILTDKIEQAINTVNLNEPDFTQKALRSNVIFTVKSLQQSRPVLNEAIHKHELKIVGAVYDLKTGKVEWL